MKEKEWNYQNSPEGPALVLGYGFDFDSMVLLEKKFLTVRITTRKPGEYAELAEVSIPIEFIKELLEQV